MNIKTETWAGHKIRFVWHDGEWWAVLKDVAKATGYIPILNCLEASEEIIEAFTIGEQGEYLALTNKGKLLLVTHWYGDSENIIIPNVARDVASILAKNNELSRALENTIKQILQRYYLATVRNLLPNGIRKALETLTGYHREPPQIKKEQTSGMTQKHEYVYFLTADNGLTKIGRTRNLGQRIHHFTTKLPYELKETLIIKTTDSSALETHLHKMFSDKRVRGEWFQLTSEDFDNVRKYYLKDVIKNGVHH